MRIKGIVHTPVGGRGHARGVLCSNMPMLNHHATISMHKIMCTHCVVGNYGIPLGPRTTCCTWYYHNLFPLNMEFGSGAQEKLLYHPAVRQDPERTRRCRGERSGLRD